MIQLLYLGNSLGGGYSLWPLLLSCNVILSAVLQEEETAVETE